MEVSSYVLKSSKNNSFGTAFYVDKDEMGSFLITCAHVIEACEKENLIIKNRDENLSAKLIDIGSSDGIDLAVIYVEGLLKDTLKSLFSTLEEKKDTAIHLNGFKLHKQDIYLEKKLNGNILEISKIHTKDKIIKTYELIIENDNKIEKGYSGSAIIVDEKIIGVATDRENNGKKAYAIPIKYLEDIWRNIPKEFFNIKEEKKQNILKKISNDEKIPKEVRESSKKFLEYFYMIKKYPKLSLIAMMIVVLWYFKDTIYSEVRNYIDSNNSENKIVLEEETNLSKPYVTIKKKEILNQALEGVVYCESENLKDIKITSLESEDKNTSDENGKYSISNIQKKEGKITLILRCEKNGEPIRIEKEVNIKGEHDVELCECS